MTGLDLSLLDREVSRMPVLPEAVRRILGTTRRDDVDLGHVEAALRRGPGLAARVLRVANSPFNGCAGQIASIREACMILGIHTLRNLTLTATVLDAYPGYCIRDPG